MMEHMINIIYDSDNYIKSVSDSKLKNIFINEKISLKRFGDALLKLNI